jgi:hypothetical protein
MRAPRRFRSVNRQRLFRSTGHLTPNPAGDFFAALVKQSPEASKNFPQREIFRSIAASRQAIS